MRRTWILLGMGAIAGGLCLFGCAAPAEIKPAAPPPTPVAVASGSLIVPEDQPAQLVTFRFPLPAPISTEVEKDPELDDSDCIVCHTSQEDLKQLAEEPEEEEELSEGEG